MKPSGPTLDSDGAGALQSDDCIWVHICGVLEPVI